MPVHRRVPSAWRRTPSGKDWLAQQNRMCKAGLAPAQGRENVYSPPIGDTIGECLSVNHDGVIDTEHHMPAQRAMFVEHVIGKARGDLVDCAQNFGDRAGRHRNRPVLQLRKEPVKMLRHLNSRHGVQPNAPNRSAGNCCRGIAMTPHGPPTHRDSRWCCQNINDRPPHRAHASGRCRRHSPAAGRADKSAMTARHRSSAQQTNRPQSPCVPNPRAPARPTRYARHSRLLRWGNRNAHPHRAC